MNAHEILKKGAKTYEERNKVYGDNYKRIGLIMHTLFPDGVVIDTPGAHDRFHSLHMILTKLTRYAINFDKGGHLDSAHDLMVYAAILEEVTDAPDIRHGDDRPNRKQKHKAKSPTRNN